MRSSLRGRRVRARCRWRWLTPSTLNCRHRADGDSCGVCPDCRQIAALAHPDLHLVFPVNKQGKKSGEVITSDAFLPLFRTVFARSNGYFSPQEWYDALDLGKTLRGAISAREADEIIRKLSFKSFEAEYKVMLVWLPETMNEEAANKILKILEEPWEKTVFLLVSEAPDRLLQTILSRTQEVGRSAHFDRGVGGGGGAARPERSGAAAQPRAAGRRRLSDVATAAGRRGRRTDARLFRTVLLAHAAELQRQTPRTGVVGRGGGASLARTAAGVPAPRGASAARELHASRRIGRHQLPVGRRSRFLRKFAPFIGNENVEFLLDEIERAMRQITQNGNPTIVFTHFALSVSKQIRRKIGGDYGTCGTFDGRQRRRREGASAHGAAVGQRPHRSRAALFALLRERPVGFEAEQPFVNQVWWPTPISRRTRCSPRCTASSGSWGATVPAEAVERAATGQRYVSRPIDIDILLYDDEVISTPELTIPHPGIAEREFVLTPLCEVLRQRPHPVLGLTMGELRDNLLRKTK